ncbi:MAG: hypothetical protein QF893_13070 [Alphaproteobacteria bacterium]|jgi:hypothetical protein|nr:hypothetical protein [Alphaproteobacteria bacterium]
MPSNKDSERDALRQRIDLLRQDAVERPHIADMLLKLVDELEAELARLVAADGPSDPDQLSDTTA